MRFILALAALALSESLELTRRAAKSSADLFVHSLPDFEGEMPVMHAGTLLANPQSQGELFFWSIDAKYKGDTAPRTILWLNGGPGCSSMDGMFLEMGPFTFGNSPDHKITARNGSWHEYANIVFLDQPLGVGYSPAKGADYVSELDAAGENVVEFLEAYFEVFPEHLNDELFIAGESYAGQYIPYIYKAFKARQESRREKNIDFNVPDIKGLMLLSPWIDSSHQYLSHYKFLQRTGLLKSEQDKKNEEILHNQCLQSLGNQELQLPDNAVCNKVLQYAIEHFNDGKTCFNIYDYRMTDSYPSCGMNWPDGVSQMKTYLSRNDVRKALNTLSGDQDASGSKAWQECDSTVQSRFKALKNPTASTQLPKILAEVPVIIMSGDYDVICNVDGLRGMIESMTWGSDTKNNRGFDETQGEARENLQFDGNSIGSFQSGRNLTFVTFDKGTHMLPVNLNFEVRAVMHAFTGISKGYDLQAVPGIGSNNNKNGTASTENNQKSINEAMNRAYKQAGITALIVVIIFIVCFFVWLQWRGEGGISCTDLLNGILHIGRPRRAPEYINLRAFKRSTHSRVPDTIQEESEPEEA